MLAVPVAGVLYIIALALYSDATRQTELLVAKPRRTTYSSLRHVIEDRRGTRGPGAQARVPATAAVSAPATIAVTSEVGAVSVVTSPELAPAASAVAVEANERLASIAQDQTQLIAQFEAGEAEIAEQAEQAEQVEQAEALAAREEAGEEDEAKMST